MVNINYKDNNNDSSNGDNKNNKKNYRDHLKDDETIKSTSPSDTESSSSDSDRNKKKVSISTYYKFSTLLAFIITIPGVIVLFVLRHFEVDIIYQIISSSLAFFICIALSFKISSKLTKFYKN